MAINLNDNIKVLAGKATDARYLNNLTPYASTTEVNTIVTSALRYRGLTVNVAGVEYWYKDGILDGNLVIKDSAISGVGITGATNGLTKSGSNVKLGGALTEVTNITGSQNVSFGTVASRICDFSVNSGNGNINLIAEDVSGISGGGLYAEYNTATGDGENHYFFADKTGIGLGSSSSTAFGDTFELRSTGIEIGLGAGNTMNYKANYASNFTARSLVDAAYVTGKTSTSGIQTASNGLTKSGTDVKLGGTISQTTKLSGSSDLCISAPFTACNIQNFIFDETPTPDAYQEGRLYYKNNALNLDREFSGVTLQIGEETVVKVMNVTGAPIADGSAVYITGAIGGLPTIAKSIASNPYQANNTIGLVTKTVADNAETYVTLNGTIHDLNTIGFTVGQPVYLSSTVAGGLTATKPSYPNEVIHIGYVTVVSATVGEILVMLDVETPYTTIGQFTGYTASTNTRIDNKLETSVFTTYTGNTATCISYLDKVADVALTGATNGLSYANRCVCLGGTLASPTTVSGSQALTLGDLNGITLSTAGTNDIGLNAKSNGGVYLKSQSGTVASVSDFTNAVGIAVDFNALGGFAIYDCRAGASQTGIIYAADYSGNYTSRSLVDKAYVDSVATGLNVHGAVAVATIAPITLSGLSTVDGVALSNGDRVLVKDQANGTLNGIYIASATTWQRSSDYNFNPTGEVSNGDLIPVISGNTNANSQWILVSQNPIISGTTNLVFSLFSQQQGIVEGNGICVTTVGTNKQIAVKTSASASGLCFDGAALELDWTTYRNGLCACPATGKIDVRACTISATGSEVFVKINTGGTNTLFIDNCDIKTCLGTPIISANNGLSKNGCIVSLGGALTGDTTITGNAGAYDLSFSGLDSFALGYDNTAIITDSNGSPKGLQYAADYSGTYTTRSLTDKAYVDGKVISGVNAGSGLSKGSNNTIILGGTLTGNTQIIYGANRLCFVDGGTSSMDMISDCSRIHTENTSLYLQSCTNGTCNGIIGIANTGAICLTSNNATLPICVTAPHGMKYAANYSANYTCLSIPHVGWVTGFTSQGITDATNGLTKVGQSVKLGGTLTGNTDICLNGSSINLGCNTEPTYLGIDSLGEFINTQASSNTYFNLCGVGGGQFADLSVGGNSILYLNNSSRLARIGTYDTCISMCGASGVQRMNLQANTVQYIDINGTSGNEYVYAQANTNQYIEIGGVTGSECVDIRASVNTRVMLNGVNTEEYVELRANSVLLCLQETGFNVFADTTKQKGLEYAADYSANFTDRSLVDKAYVDNSTGSLGGNNGLSRNGDNIVLGGTLTGNTLIDGLFNLEFGNSANPLNSFSVCSDGGFDIYDGGGIVICDNAGNGISLNSSPNGSISLSSVSGSTTICGGSASIIEINMASMTVTDNTNLKGLVYANDYCANFTARSLVDAAYVTGKTNAAIIGWSNDDNFSTVIGCGTIPLSAYTSYGNTVYGVCALKNVTSGGETNVAIGGTALYCNGEGYSNVAIGYRTLYNNNNGGNNIGIGYDALFNNTTGNINIGIGSSALRSNTIGTANVSIGCRAGYYNVTGSSSVFIGTCAGYNETTSNKLYIANTATCSLIYGDFAANYVTLPTLKLCTTPSSGVITDSVLVWNSTDKTVKTVAGASLGDKNNIYSRTTVTTSTTLTTGSTYVILANHTAPITITLPATPLNGQAFKIKDASGDALTNNVTVSGNGNNIDGAATGLLNTDYGAIEIVYDSTLGAWFSLAFIN